MPTKIRVLLADDHRVVCEALKQALGQSGDFEVVGTAENGREAVRLTRKLQPDVAVLDVAMPELNGIEAAEQIRKVAPETRVLALSMHSDRRYIEGMLASGVAGYLLKDCAFEELARAIKTVMKGGVYLSPQVAAIVVKDYTAGVHGAAAQPAASLTPREKEILQLLAEGNRVRDISERLHLSVKTVDTHRRQIMKKLGLNSVAQLTKYAIREGITSLDE